jgi:hypothetical protein
MIASESGFVLQKNRRGALRRGIFGFVLRRRVGRRALALFGARQANGDLQGGVSGRD